MLEVTSIQHSNPEVLITKHTHKCHEFQSWSTAMVMPVNIQTFVAQLAKRGIGSNRGVSSILTEGHRVAFSATGLGWVFSTNSTLKKILFIDFLRTLILCKVNRCSTPQWANNGFRSRFPSATQNTRLSTQHSQQPFARVRDELIKWSSKKRNLNVQSVNKTSFLNFITLSKRFWWIQSKVKVECFGHTCICMQ